MNIGKFFSQYSDNESCKRFFKERREEWSIKCRRCGSEHQYWINCIFQWECARCKYRTGLKCGTVMEHSKLDFRVWLWALYLMALTKKGFQVWRCNAY